MRVGSSADGRCEGVSLSWATVKTLATGSQGIQHTAQHTHYWCTDAADSPPSTATSRPQTLTRRNARTDTAVVHTTVPSRRQTTSRPLRCSHSGHSGTAVRAGRVAAVVIGLSCVAPQPRSIRCGARRVPEFGSDAYEVAVAPATIGRPRDATCGMKANQQPIDGDKWERAVGTRAASGRPRRRSRRRRLRRPAATSRAAAATASTPRRRRATPSATSPRTTRATTRSSSPALPWRYTTSGFHATSGGYVDQLKFSAGVTSGGNAKARRPPSSSTPSARRHVGSPAPARRSGCRRSAASTALGDMGRTKNPRSSQPAWLGLTTVPSVAAPVTCGYLV